VVGDQPVTSASSARLLLPKHTAHVGGDWVADTSGQPHVHVYPADGSILGEWRLPGPRDVDTAVEAARQAQQQWLSASPGQRRDTLLAIAGAVRENRHELAAVVTLEMGMPFKASVAGVVQAAEWFSHYAGYADKIDGLVPQVGPATTALDYVTYQPYGVIGAIIPWNGPILALGLKLAPALAAGNAVVLKPSELAPFSSLRFSELVTRAGLPSGLVNVLPGGPDVGQHLCGHPGIGLITFTGGGSAARSVSEAAAARQVPTVLELGGKSASIVFADADPQKAARLGALLGVAQNSGQGCFLPTRMLVQREIYDAVVDGVVAAVQTFRLGDPFDPAVTMGPVVNAASCARILGAIERARDEQHGRLVFGGARAHGDLSDGFFIEPTVFADVDPLSPLAQEEIFGPVLSILPFDTEDEAVRLANETRFGLAGYVWTNDLRRAHRVAGALHAGYVSVNGMALLPPGAPFGGWKASGHGTEGGRAGLAEFLRAKNVHVQL
jgi:aldehyde dehydrogenase (NAD+)